jgi:hypothetical protein
MEGAAVVATSQWAERRLWRNAQFLRVAKRSICAAGFDAGDLICRL